jgi:hypothetical protein
MAGRQFFVERSLSPAGELGFESGLVLAALAFLTLEPLGFPIGHRRP